MNKQLKKIIAPVVITLLLIVYLASFIRVSVGVPLSTAGRITGILIPLGLVGVSCFVLWERIKEIRSGEEDDISKY